MMQKYLLNMNQCSLLHQAEISDINSKFDMLFSNIEYKYVFTLAEHKVGIDFQKYILM